MQMVYHITGGDFINAGKASSAVKGILKQLDVPAPLIKRVVIALYETEVNVAAHAYEGEIRVAIETDNIHIVVSDRGPGITDIQQAMQKGYSTASPEVREMGFGAGMGLPNIKKNSDKFSIVSTPGEGTTVEIINKLSD
jgi:anti-sigma regulatory factor (Ser/Thr protein kinase)